MEGEGGKHGGESNWLERIGRALALSMQLHRYTLGSGDEDQALEMLVGVYSFFAMAQAVDRAPGIELIDVLGELHQVAFALRRQYPQLRSRVRRVVKDGAVDYDPCPF